MSKTRILKITVPMDDEMHELEGVYDFAQIVHVAAQHERMTVWFVEDQRVYVRPPDNKIATVVGTGHVFDEELIHLGSAIFSSGWLVFHLMGKP